MKLSTIATAAAALPVIGLAGYTAKQHTEEAPLRQMMEDDSAIIMRSVNTTGGLCSGETRMMEKRSQTGPSLSFNLSTENPKFEIEYERTWDRPWPLSWTAGQQGSYSGTIMTFMPPEKRTHECTTAHYSFASGQYIPETAFPEAGK